MAELPESAAWRHVDARDGFEVLFTRRLVGGYGFDGQSTGVEDGAAWSNRYTITVGPNWATRSAHVVGHSAAGAKELRLESDGDGRWRVDGRPAPDLDGCLDVDLEASAFTNAFPVRRIGLEVGENADAPAVWIRAADLAVERLEQSYARFPDDGDRSRYDYRAPDLDFECVLVYDELGLVLEYPGIAVRVA
jgi:hypothetical protein